MRRGILIGIAAGVAVLAAAGAGAWWLWGRPAGPDAAARAYLEALAAGNGERALALLADPPADAETTLAAFDGATGRVTNPEIASSDTESEAIATADVTFTLDGEAHSATITLRQSADGWHIADDGLGSLTPLPSIGDTVAIGAALVLAESPTRLLPAVYPVAPAPVGLVEGGAHATVLPGGEETLEIDVSVGAAAADAARQQLSAHLAACTAPAAEVPTGCGIRVPWAADFITLEGLRYRIDQEPELEIASDGAFTAEDGVLVVTATGAPRAGGPGSVTYRADPWSLYGEISFTGNEMVLLVR